MKTVDVNNSKFLIIFSFWVWCLQFEETWVFCNIYSPSK